MTGKEKNVDSIQLPPAIILDYIEVSQIALILEVAICNNYLY